MTSKATTPPAQTALIPVNVDDYAVLQFDAAEMGEILQDNLGGQGLTAWDLSRVTIPAGGGGMWEVENAEGPAYEEAIEGVIVGQRGLRAYWENPEVSGTPPDCSSLDTLIGNGAFGPRSVRNPSGACRDCPMAQFGSGKAGRGQACKQKNELYVIRPTDMLPIVVTAPPTSLKAVRKYMVAGLAGRGLRYHAAVTRLGLAREKNDQGQAYAVVVPALVGPLGPEAAAKMRAYAEGLRAAFTSTPPLSDAPAFDEHGEPL